MGSFANPLADRALHRGHAYQLGRAKATVRFGGVRFELKGRAVFSLGCYGQVVGGPLLPSLHLQSGSVRVFGSVSDPGGVDTTEALANPVLGYKHRLSFTVTRRLTTPAQLTEAGMFFDTRGVPRSAAGYEHRTNRWRGVHQHHSLRRRKPGTCRHADSAVLRTTGRKNHNFAGSASYHGLH